MSLDNFEFVDNGPSRMIGIRSRNDRYSEWRLLGWLDADSGEWFFKPNKEYGFGYTSQILMRIRQMILKLNSLGGCSVAFTHEVLPNGQVIQREAENE